MAIPSSQVLASWVKLELASAEWRPLREVAFDAVKARWSNRSDDELWDYIEANEAYVAEHLRDESSECLIDGGAPRFEIDNEPAPYLRALNLETSETLNRLRATNPFQVETICADILKKLGAAHAMSTQRTNDGGVDFIARNLNIVTGALRVPTACSATIIGQTKRFKEGNLVGETRVREFVGAATLRKHQLQADGSLGPLTPTIFAFWTTSDFDPNAKKYARAVGLWYMDGHTLANYLISLGISEFASDQALPFEEAISSLNLES